MKPTYFSNPYPNMTKQEIYRSKLGTLQDALDMIQGGDCIIWPIHANEPKLFLDKLHSIAGRLTEPVNLWAIVHRFPHEVLSSTDPAMDKFHISSFFYDGQTRTSHPSGRVSYFPCNLHNFGEELNQANRPNVFVAQVSAMDEFGYCHATSCQQWAQENFETAEKVIFEVNPRLPRGFGEAALPVERANVIYELDEQQAIDGIPIVEDPPMTPEEQTVADYVVSLARDGDCFQLGFGGIPAAIGNSLVDKWDLGIHSEQFSSSMAKLMANGNVSNRHKAIDQRVSVAAFAIGDQFLYDYMDRNPRIHIRRGSYTNDPVNICKNDNVLSINGGLQYDLTGQICSESIGPTQYSGTGGATDFAYGAYHSKGGRGIIASVSTTKKGTVSRIVPTLEKGSIVTISRNLADYVITEYGIARLRQRTVKQRVENLIAVAHPDFRAELRREADRLMYY